MKGSCPAVLYFVFVCVLNRCALCSMGMTQSDTLHPPSAGGEAGEAVAFGTNWIAVGAPSATVTGNVAQGAVYVYAHTADGTWNLTNTLTAASGAANDRFGHSLAADGNILAVGSSGDDQIGNEAGAVYLFETDGTNWTQTAVLIADDGTAGHFFGISVDLDGDILAVGARKAPVAGKTAAGAVYVFQRSGEGFWQQVQKLTADDAVSFDYFGGAVSLEGDELLIGANDNDDNGSKSGSAYLFRFDAGGTEQWQQSALLVDADGASLDLLGSSVSLNNGLAAVGAPGAFSAAGAVCLFARNEGGSNLWGQVAKLLPSNLPDGIGFGGSVALSESRVFVGAPDSGLSGALAAGSLYLFDAASEGLSWKETERIDADLPSESARFGASVAQHENWLAVGSPGCTNAGERAGAVYLFHEESASVAITAISVNVSGVHLSWRGGTEYTQILERAASLQSGDWLPLLTNTPPTAAEGSYSDISEESMRFYRMLEIR